MENKKVVLITEDESTLRRALHDKLGAEGLMVLEAKNGEEGLEIALKEHPDLILVDIIMPKMDGLTMLQKLRENDEGKKIKFIILTNLDSTEHIANAIKAVGGDESTFEYYIKTDTKLEDIVEKVEQKLLS